MLTKGQEVLRIARLNGYNEGLRAIPRLEQINEGQFKALVEMSRNAAMGKQAHMLGFLQGLQEAMAKIQRELEHTLQLERSGTMKNASAKKLVDYRLKHQKREQQKRRA